jgi:hypothetical protein
MSNGFRLGTAFVCTWIPSVAFADDCWAFHYDISTTLYTEGCTSPVGLCTTGEVTWFGFHIASTTFQAVGLGGGAVGEESIVTPPAEPATTWSYAGDFAMDTWFGDVELEDVGVFDTSMGVFSEMQRVVGGDGFFDGATGVLWSYGFARADGTGFDGKLVGEICSPD